MRCQTISLREGPARISWGIRAGALVLSFALWLHAVAVRLWIEVPPPGEGVDGDMVLASEVPSTVRVLVTGGGKDLLFDLDDDSFVMKLRAEGKNRIHRLTPSQITKRAADLDVEVKEILEPKEIAIALAPRMERDVPVRVQASLEVAAAHVQVTPVQADPALVRVIGPQQQVAALRYVDTDSLVLQDIREDVDVKWSLRHPEHTQLAFVPEAVSVRALCGYGFAGFAGYPGRCGCEVVFATSRAHDSRSYRRL